MGVHMTLRNGARLFAACSFSFLALVVAFALIAAVHEDDERLNAIEAATTPIIFVKLQVNEPQADVQVVQTGVVLAISYKIDPWAMTKSSMQSTFKLKLRDILPGVFRKFRDIDQIDVTTTAAFQDQRGHESRGNLIRASFTRSNAKTIVWEKVALDAMPGLADRFWQHPSFARD
jgi:hypothetical protein